MRDFFVALLQFRHLLADIVLLLAENIAALPEGFRSLLAQFHKCFDFPELHACFFQTGDQSKQIHIFISIVADPAFTAVNVRKQPFLFIKTQDICTDVCFLRYFTDGIAHAEASIISVMGIDLKLALSLILILTYPYRVAKKQGGAFMKKATDGYTLSNGVKIPCIGFGTWQTPDGSVAVSSVRCAIESGYRHIDTAQAYGNEGSVGQGIRESGIAREELFVTTKLWNENHSYDLVLSSVDESLKKLGLDYLDLFLIHWPNPLSFRDHWQKANAETWKAMEKLYEEGRIRAIGVSNFRQHHIDELMKTANIAPMVNQIRLCPGDTQDAVVDYCRAHDMLLEAYSPLGVGRVFDVPEMKAMAEKYGRSIAQVCIRWSIQRGYLPLPKSVTPSRIADNLKVFDFELEESDVEVLAGLTGCAGMERDPDQTNF